MTATQVHDRRVAREQHDDVGQRAALLDHKQLLARGSDAARAVLADLRDAVRVAPRGAA